MNLTVFPTIEKLSVVIVPIPLLASLYPIEYLSWSKVDQDALDIPKVVIFNSKLPSAVVVFPVSCSVIIIFESDRFKSETLSSDNCAYNLLSPRINGAPTKALTISFDIGKPPSNTPVTVSIPTTSIEVLSEETEFIHVSGHPNREDLKDMYQWVKPKCVIPVHGEHRHMIEHINFAKEMQVPFPVQVENGDIVKLYPGNAPEVYDKAPSGRLYLDVNVSVEEDSQSIKDRKNLSANGYLEVTILITPKGNIHNSPITTFRGLPIYEKEEFIYGLENEIEKTTRSFKLGSKQQEHNLIDALKISCRKFTKEKTGKKPFTNINLVKI